MYFGLCVTFSLLAVVFIFSACMDAFVYLDDDSIGYKDEISLKRKIFIYFIIASLLIGAASCIHHVGTNKDTSDKLHLDDKTFQENLISSYKEKNGLDKDIIDYSDYISSFQNKDK